MYVLFDRETLEVKAESDKLSDWSPTASERVTTRSYYDKYVSTGKEPSFKNKTGD